MSGARPGFGPNATSPLRFQWRGGVRSVSVSRLSILGIKTGRRIGHTTRGRKEGGIRRKEGRKEGRNTFIPFPQVEVEWVSRKKSSYAETGNGVLYTLSDSFLTLYANHLARANWEFLLKGVF